MAAVLVETETLSPKLRGGYYTPAPIAQFLAEWVIRSPADRVLEPSCGDGALVEAAAQRLLALGTTPTNIGTQLRATELFTSEARVARQRLQQLGINKECVVIADFFSALGSAGGQLAFDTTLPALQNARFDAVIGNPPFLRFQNFPEEQRQLAFHEMHQAGLRPNRLTNAWVPFLVAAAERLTATGRLAMVIPAELLQVGYAAETRAYLARSFATVTIVTFKKLVFDTIQQEVVLLLAERGTAAAHTIDIVELEDARNLRDIASKIMVNNSHKPLYEAKDKWTLYFLEPAEIDLIQQLSNRKDIPRLGDFAKVEVGVVTGNNSFFVQSNQNIINRKIKDFAKPLVGRTAQLPGLLYTAEDHEKQCLTNTGCWLLDIPAAVDLPEKMSAYIIEGEQAEVHTGYKCRIRPSWYTVPSIWTPDAFLFRQIYKAPKLVANLTRATSTDTVHRMRLRQPIDVQQLAGSFYNVLTFAFAEIMGRSYGGGVLEIEPSEAGHIPVPLFDNKNLDIAELDTLERLGKTQEILKITNRILKENISLDATDQERLNKIWLKLSERRLSRKKGSKKKKAE